MNVNIYKPMPDSVVENAMDAVMKGKSYDWQTVAEILASQLLYLQGEMEFM